MSMERRDVWLTTDTITVPDLRALDALVAEHIMGWELSQQGTDTVYDAWVTRHPNGVVKTLKSASNWSPTTDPRDWMQAVEKMRELGFHSMTWRIAGKWISVTFYSPEGQAFVGSHEDEGVATSLAALEAVTGKRVVLESWA